MFSGGALSRFTVFALGIMPYISASIIMQLMTYVVPTLEALKKEGESGRRKITQYTRYGTLGLALFQSLGIALALEGSPGLVISPGFGFRLTAVVSLVAGTMFLMWLGEQITERGLGNGISILIFSGIAAGQPIYVMLYAAAIVFFCFFYTALVFNSRETADNLKKSGAFIPGIRPGDQTARHIDRILSRLTLAGAIYITAVCLLPEFLVLKYNVPFYFGGTSLLIIVVVTMDFWAQVQSYVMSQQYESLLKKANFKAS